MRIRLNWGTSIALVYTAFATATAGFVAFAIERPVDLVSDDYYAQSLQQDQRMDAEWNARALTPAPALVQSDRAAIVLSLPRAHAATASGTVTFYRASDASADRVQPLTIDSEGRQEIGTGALAKGQWLVQVKWSANGRAYYFERPMVLP